MALFAAAGNVNDHEMHLSVHPARSKPKEMFSHRSSFDIENIIQFHFKRLNMKYYSSEFKKSVH